ncbi:ribonucleotide reductase stimulatory protein [Aerococcus urinaehominis]|uniref:Ribonucleotide reductase stimulatory protein n=1 Tax=Aerococcus urinaehominis TaxID=128944 RepID=A0A0X8FL94_9LACT|nr:class Ib ribonucleoside-diphosphate reductase assembly flavoprotein NrdI [Aerococcus urinaehominis]AMB99154.1 ribonucleotide reductase stimulatory protein [Aerococcus urinaehominis]SDM05589.1 protein involved in ribonucleotide reduction [Aerococcus urinaehominis]
MLFVYMSVVGNTRRFVAKLDQPSLEIDDSNCFTEIDQDFILVAPTYAIEVTDVLNDFLESGKNLSYCRGVMGGGNRNFNDLFCFTAKDLCDDYHLPLLHMFEFMGSENDVKKVKEIVAEIENTSRV